MCSVSGILIRSRQVDERDVATLDRMNSAMIHRGPDGEGKFVGENVALAMRRLSIIDLSGGWQPLYNEAGDIALVCNGEIYNHVELRANLVSKGHTFLTGSDCEVIVHLYEEYGDDCVNHLRGMFAFAMWDLTHRRLILARDRMGEKPLYLCELDDQLLFASELKGIIASEAIPFELDPVSIDQYFHYNYVPEPRTPLKGIRKLPAGSVLVVDWEGWRKVERRYWRMEESPPLEGASAWRIREQLDLISKQIVQSDVPVGIALSAGLDSSIVAALAARQYPGTLKAFCVGYSGNPENDERDDARKFADYLGIPFFDVEVAVSDVVASFSDLNYWRDEPIADISGYGYYAVMKLAHDHGVKVMLQGQGGDELFWGYPWLRKAAEQTHLKSEVREHGLKRLFHVLASNLVKPTELRSLLSCIRRSFGLGAGLRIFRDYRESDPNRLVMFDLTPDFAMAKSGLHFLYTDNFKEHLAETDPASLFCQQQPWSDINVELTRIICHTYLMGNGIAQGDRLSMASSVELRLPLVDSRLVETIIGIRKAHPDHRLPPKYWLKEAVQDIVPDWVMNRKKRGFTPPILEWCSALFRAYGQQLDGGYLVKAGVITAEAGRILAGDSRIQSAITPFLFKALVLENWCQKMISQKSDT
jgi:asparagine synthase (glutamine-hydrolysing)